MKRKLSFGLMMLATLFAASCAKELVEAPVLNEEAKVTFSVNTPEIATRAYSDGTTATVLQYAVYDENGVELTALTKTDATINGSTTVELQLTTGNTYSVIFWAAAEDAPYAVDFAEKTMTVNYDNAVSNDEARDAFYKYHTFTVTGAQTETIELKRPFAQLNIGTADYTASTNAGYTPRQSSVTVPVYTTLNLASGDVDGQVTKTFALANIKKDETFPVAGNEYLAMNYLLVASDKEVVDVEFTYTNGADAKTRTVGSVPVQRNYRTNIYGNLLTSQVDIKVEIVPEYEEPDYSIYNVVVDGVSYDDFATAVAKAMEIGKPVEFIQNVAIDADETITVPAGKELTLNLNGYTLKGVSDEKGSNRNMFDVRGTMTVDGANTLTKAAAEGNGTISIRHDGENMGWGSSTNVFNVTAGGVLNIMNTHAINFGGSDMGFVAHLNNWGEVTLNVENSTLESNYVAVRVFNSGPDKNNVTIKNSTLKGGSYAFWVHNYTVADFGTQEKADAHKALLNLDIFNGTNIFIGKNDTPVRFGFTDSEYADENGVFAITVSSAAALTEALGKGVSVILGNDIDFGSTQLAITGENQVVDLGGHALTTANNWGGISLKNGATIKNGTITHAGNTAAIKAFNGSSVENVTINATCATADKTVTGIAVQQGATVESIKNVTINGVSQGIEVGYQATVGLIENAVVNESNNGTAKGIGLVINGGKVGKAKDCTFKGETYGITMHLKGVFAAGLELENCTVEGTTASIYAWDEKGISNTSGSLVLTYDAATTLTGPFVWDFEDECQSVVTLNKPQ